MDHVVDDGDTVGTQVDDHPAVGHVTQRHVVAEFPPPAAQHGVQHHVHHPEARHRAGHPPLHEFLTHRRVYLAVRASGCDGGGTGGAVVVAGLEPGRGAPPVVVDEPHSASSVSGMSSSLSSSRPSPSSRNASTSDSHARSSNSRLADSDRPSAHVFTRALPSSSRSRSCFWTAFTRSATGSCSSGAAFTDAAAPSSSSVASPQIARMLYRRA